MKRSLCSLHAVLLIAIGTGIPGLRAGDDVRPAPRLPVVGRPEWFDEEDGPVGSFEQPSLRVEPREVQVDDPVTVTIRVGAAGPVQRPPKQIRLEKFPGFTEQFYIEYPDDPTFRQINTTCWEFTCTLKPRSTNVTSIPSVPFVFFTPGFLPPERGYQVRRTATVPIAVRAREEVPPSAVHGSNVPPPFPEIVYDWAASDVVLRRASTWSPELLLTIGVLGLLVPPVGCAAWCMAWRRHPSAAYHRHGRRSQAAQRALTLLRRGEDDPRPVAAIVTTYLQERYDVTAREPTPSEVYALLHGAGCSKEQIESAVEFFQNYDARCFGRATLAVDLAAAARRLIVLLEADLC